MGILEPIEIAKELREEIFNRDRKVVAFICSGLSVGPYLSWKDIIIKLCQECDISLSNEDLREEDFTKIADKCKQKDENKYYKILKEEYGEIKDEIRIIYNYLIEVPFKAYVTTNFDPSLAELAKIHKKSRIYCYPDLNIQELRNGNVFYIHGTLSKYGHGKKIVFSYSEFEEAYSTKTLLPPFLKNLFTLNTTVFIGCGLKEQPLRRLLRIIKEIKYNLSSTVKRPLPDLYILKPKDYEKNEIDKEFAKEKNEKREQEVEFFKEIGIKIIWYEKLDKNHKGLTEIFRKWAGVSSTIPDISFEDVGGVNE